MEVWKDVVGYEGRYQVSNKGRVKSLNYKRSKKPKLLTTTLHDWGYLQVRLKRKTFYVHRLVAEAFLPNPESKPTVNHLDGNKANNKLVNLEWATLSENNKHAYKIGLKDQSGAKNGFSKLKQEEVLTIYLLKDCKGITQKEIADVYNVNHSTVSNIQNKKNWKILTDKINKDIL